MRKKKKKVFLLHHVSANPVLMKSSCILDTSLFNYFIRNVSFDTPEVFLKKEKSNLLTFDDGLSDVFEIAFPILLELKIPFIIFINPSTIGKDGYLNKNQILKMIDSNLCFVGSHGYEHIDLIDLSNDQIITSLKKQKVL